MTNEELLRAVTAHLRLHYPGKFAVFDDFDDTRHIWNQDGTSSMLRYDGNLNDFTPGELIVWEGELDAKQRITTHYTLD